MNTILWWIHYLGLTTSPSMMLAFISMGAAGLLTMKINYDNAKEEQEQEQIRKNFEKMEAQKKKIALDLWNEEQQRKNEEVKNDYNNMLTEQKEIALNEYRLAESTCDTKYPYKGIKPPTMYGILLGHDSKGNPIWGNSTNYIVAGTTGAGKTRKMWVCVLNYLACKQGTLYIGDLKGTDFFMFKNKRHVVKYISELENAAELIKAFEHEYEARKALFHEGGYINLDDYNNRSGNKLRLFTLVIDEYADIADCYQDKNKRPIGVYADIVRLSRKVRSFGGRIILGTQRPDATVICGQLKNNCSILGLQCVNSISSTVMVGTEGCERLRPTEGLIVMNGKLNKVFAYSIPDELLDDYVGRLK